MLIMCLNSSWEVLLDLCTREDSLMRDHTKKKGVKIWAKTKLCEVWKLVARDFGWQERYVDSSKCVKYPWQTHMTWVWELNIYLLHMLWLKIILYGPLWWGKCFLGCFESRSVWKEYWEGNRRCFQVKMSLWCDIVSKTVWAWYIYLVHWMLWLHCFGIRNRRNVINKRILIQ